MNHLLAIDTSTPACSVALQVQTEAGTKRFAAFEQSSAKHTHVLLPMINNLLQQAKLQPKDLDGILVSIGPGAFTGLRVGASVALGLAYGTGAKLCPVSSLALLAQTAQRHTGKSLIVSTLDARMEAIYGAVYQHGKALCPDALFAPKALWERVQHDYADAVLVGSGLHYPPFSSELSWAHLLPEAQDTFDLPDLVWHEPSQSLELNYLRNDVVDQSALGAK